MRICSAKGARTPTSDNVLLSKVCRWDAIHFMTIAERGYFFIKNAAFLPLSIPINLLPFSLVVLANSLLKASSASLMLSIYKELKLTQTEAFRAALCFAFNGASIFYASAYSQALYSTLYLGALFALLRRKIILSNFLLVFSGFSRSTYIFTVILLGFPQIKELYCHIQGRRPGKAVLTIIKGTINLAVLLTPLLIWHLFTRHKFCSDYKYPFCNSFLGNPYSYVQSQFWTVGFLSYWKIQNILNFLWASPAFYFTYKAVLNGRFSDQTGISLRIQTGVQGTTSLLMAHFQPYTRFMSSNPLVIYELSRNRMWQYYLLVYNIFGIVFFSRGYVWT